MAPRIWDRHPRGFVRAHRGHSPCRIATHSSSPSLRGVVIRRGAASRAMRPRIWPKRRRVKRLSANCRRRDVRRSLTFDFSEVGTGEIEVDSVQFTA